MEDPRSEALTSRPDPKVGKGAGKDGPKLLGPALTGKEGARALDHRPKDKKTGKFLCWDNRGARRRPAFTTMGQPLNGTQWIGRYSFSF